MSQWPGAYFKIGFSGTSVKLNVDLTPLSTGSLSTALYPFIRYSIDNGAFTTVQLPSSGTTGFNVTGLTSGNHTLVGYFVQSEWTVDKWNANAGAANLPYNIVKITSLTLDAGAASVAPSGTIAL